MVDEHTPVFFPVVKVPQILEVHGIDEKLQYAQSSYILRAVILCAEWYKTYLGTIPIQILTAEELCDSKHRDMPYSWKHTASFSGFEGKMAAPNILQKKHLEHLEQQVLCHLLLETMVSPAQLVVDMCSFMPPKSWPNQIITEVTFVSVLTAGYQIYWDTSKGKPKLLV